MRYAVCVETSYLSSGRRIRDEVGIGFQARDLDCPIEGEPGEGKWGQHGVGRVAIPVVVSILPHTLPLMPLSVILPLAYGCDRSDIPGGLGIRPSLHSAGVVGREGQRAPRRRAGRPQLSCRVLSYVSSSPILGGICLVRYHQSPTSISLDCSDVKLVSKSHRPADAQ